MALCKLSFLQYFFRPTLEDATFVMELPQYLNPAPEARREVSPARKRWVSGRKRAERRRRDTLPENVSRIIFHAVLFQQCNEFLFKRHFPMVLFLILDIPHHG